MTAKYGTPYFSNYINSDMEPNDVRSMCCAPAAGFEGIAQEIRRILRQRRKQPAPSAWSLSICPVSPISAKDKDDFYRRLDKMMDIVARSLKTKRTIITKLLNEGLYPYTQRYLGDL